MERSHVAVVLQCSLLLGATTVAPSAHADNRELTPLLDTAGAYVRTYAKLFKDLVAEESYRQELEPQIRAAGEPLARRTRADIVFVAVPGPLPWSCFRDVIEVDGNEVPDHADRLESLFLEGGRTAIEEAAAIRSESARFNIGVPRNVNDPTLPLMFLHPDNQSRFDFRIKGRPRVRGVRVVELAFRELAEPTLITEEGRPNLFSTGRLWVNPTTGAVVRTEAVWKSRFTRLAATISVDYQPVPDLPIWVPAKMVEIYPGMRAEARYSRYRRFRVQTMEAIGLPQQVGDEP